MITPNLETAIAHWLTWANRNNEPDDTELTRTYILSTPLISFTAYPNSIGGLTRVYIYTCLVDDELGSFDLHLIEDAGDLLFIFTEVDCTFDQIWTRS